MGTEHDGGEPEDTTLEQVFHTYHYPALEVYTELLRKLSKKPTSFESEEAKVLLDELRHIAVRAFELKRLPQ